MEAIRAVGSFPSSDNQTELAYTLYLPQGGEPSAVVQVSHGMCEYFERYRPLAEYFCAHGIAVCGHDLWATEKRHRRPELLAFLPKKMAIASSPRTCIVSPYA